jgi:hypothetical protein
MVPAKSMWETEEAKSMWETEKDNADWTHLVHTEATQWTY